MFFFFASFAYGSNPISHVGSTSEPHTPISTLSPSALTAFQVQLEGMAPSPLARLVITAFTSPLLPFYIYTSFSPDAVPWKLAVLYLPAVAFATRLILWYNRWTTSRKAAKLGALVIPRVNGRFPLNLDVRPFSRSPVANANPIPTDPGDLPPPLLRGTTGHVLGRAFRRVRKHVRHGGIWDDDCKQDCLLASQ